MRTKPNNILIILNKIIRIIPGIYICTELNYAFYLWVDTSTLFGAFLVLLILGANTWDVLQAPAECAPQVKSY